MTQRTFGRRLGIRPLWIATVMAAGLAATPATARTTGIVGYSGKSHGLFCSNAGFGCHTTSSGTSAPLVRFDGPMQVDPDTDTTYRFVVTSQNKQVQIQAGFNVAASAGTLAVVSGQQERLDHGELTHTGPKDNDANGESAWEFLWHAPTTPGIYVLFGAGNSVDASTTVDGDQGAITTLMIAVGDVPPTATPSPTPTPSAAPITCAGDCDGNGTVAINELIVAVNIALGALEVHGCNACDIDHNGAVSISELITAVNKALNGC